MVTVSIILPNYNHASFLKARWDSIIYQSFQDFEVILLDDASTDNSLALLNTYKEHPKVSCLDVNSKNSGAVFQQWVKGLRCAKGRYIWIAESDDFAHVDFLKETVTLLEGHPKAGLVFTDSMIIDSKGFRKALLSETHGLLNHLSHLKQNTISTSNSLSYLINDLVIANASSALFRADALKGIDLDMLQRLSNAGDMFTYLSIAFKYDLYYLHQPLNYYRVHDYNTTQENARNGQLHKDRLMIITYFAEQLKTIEFNGFSLKLFLKRHFLVCVDFGFIKEVMTLLRTYYRLGLLNYYTYLNLKWYCYLKGKVPRTIPYFYRQFIKQQLLNTLKG